MEATTPPEEGRPAAINIVCVGDGATGKTTFLQNAVRTSVKSHPVFQTYQTQIILQKLAVTVNLRDTGGQEEFDKMRPSSYEGAHLVFVFYSIISPPSFQAVTTKVPRNDFTRDCCSCHCALDQNTVLDRFRHF
jgi:small GTP-binding protein